MRGLFLYDPTYVDWFHTPSFQEVGKKYLTIVSHYLDAQNKDNFKILDLGCHTGRTTIPLLQQGYSKTVGVDTSRMAIHTAKKTLKKLNLEGTFIRKGMERFLKNYPDESVDMIICLETLYLCRDYKNIVNMVVKSLKKKGRFFISFRNKYYVFNNLIEKSRFDDAHYVLHNKEGYIKDEGCNWQRTEDIENMLEENNIKLLELKEHGVSTLSAIKLQDYLSIYPEDKPLSMPLECSKDILIVGEKDN